MKQYKIVGAALAAAVLLVSGSLLFGGNNTPAEIRAALVEATDHDKLQELNKANLAEEEARAKLAKAEDLAVKLAQIEEEAAALRSDAAKANAWSKSCRDANVLGTVDPAVDCSVIPAVVPEAATATGATATGVTAEEAVKELLEPAEAPAAPAAKEKKELVDEFDNTDSELNEIAARFAWRYNAAGKAQAPVGMRSSGSGARAAEMLAEYGFDSRFGLTKGYGWELFKKVGARYKVKPEFLVCVAKADTSLGKALKSGYNIGNVGNNDRGNVVHLDSIGAGIDHIGLTLTNKWLGYKQSIGSLTPVGGGSAPYYASSPSGNWFWNLRNCLAEIHEDPTINADWLFRA